MRDDLCAGCGLEIGNEPWVRRTVQLTFGSSVWPSAQEQGVSIYHRPCWEAHEQQLAERIVSDGQTQIGDYIDPSVTR